MDEICGEILILGGHGHVGSRIARRLRHVRIAGRSAARAQAMADRIGASWAVLDLADPAGWDDALAGVGMVIACIDLPDSAFAASVLRRGLSYIDITASDAVLRGIQDLAPTQGRAMLSVGLAPGLTNLMAVQAGGAVRIGVLLGMGDHHGAAAIDWTLQNLRPLPRDAVQPMGFGDPPRPHWTIPFDFADQHVLARDGIRAETRLALDGPLMTPATLRLAARLAQSRTFRDLLRWGMTHLRLGSDRAALAVQGTRRITLEARAEADITALIAAETAKRMARVPPGIWHLHQQFTLEDFAPALAAEGVRITRD